MPQVPRINTPATMDRLRAELQAQGVTDRQQLAHLLAHLANESRNGKAIQNSNPGNLTALEKGKADFYRPIWFDKDNATSRRLKELHEQMLRGEAPNAFLSFPDLKSGIRVYLNKLRGPFSSMLEAKTADDFVRAWKESGYTPDLNIKATTPGFRRNVAKFGGDDKPVKAVAIGNLLPWALIGGALYWFTRKS